MFVKMLRTVVDSKGYGRARKGQVYETRGTIGKEQLILYVPHRGRAFRNLSVPQEFVVFRSDVEVVKE